MSIVRAVLLPAAVLGAAVAVRLFLAQGFSVPSASMRPTLLPGDYILVTPYRDQHRPSRQDVIVFRSGDKALRFYVKRVIGLPGDYLQLRSGQVVVNGYTLSEPYLYGRGTSGTVMPQIVPHDCYFVLGDNRQESLDSRAMGLVPLAAVVGKARVVYWSTSVEASGTRRISSIAWDRLLHRVH